MYVIVAEPSATPVTKPDEFTVATPVLLDVQAPEALLPVIDNDVVPVL